MGFRSVCLSFALLGLLYVPASAKPAHARQDYTIADLGTLGGSESFAFAINDHGDVVGLSRTAGDLTTHAFLYRNGALTDLAPLNSGNVQTTGPSDISNHGLIASGADDNGTYTPALYDARARAVAFLGSLNGVSFGVATSVNEHGHTVGYSYIDDLNRHAFIFRHGLMSDLGSFGGYSAALGINEHDAVVGFASETVNGFAHAFVFREGVMTEINPFGDLVNESIARAINDHGQVVGEGYNDGHFNGFVYDDGAVTNIGTLRGGHESRATAINNRGEVVGAADVPFVTVCEFPPPPAPCIQYKSHAIVYRGGVIADLNALIAADAGWELMVANDVNDRGEIVGYGTKNGFLRAYLLTPVGRHREETN